MSWRNLIRADLFAADAYEISIGKEQYPDGTTNVIRALQHDFRKRVEKWLGLILSACADDTKSQISYIGDLNKLWKALKAKHDTKDSYEAGLLVRNTSAAVTVRGQPRTQTICGWPDVCGWPGLPH